MYVLWDKFEIDAFFDAFHHHEVLQGFREFVVHALEVGMQPAAHNLACTIWYMARMLSASEAEYLLKIFQSVY